MTKGSARTGYSVAITVSLALYAVLVAGCGKKKPEDGGEPGSAKPAATKSADLTSTFKAATLVPSDYEWVAVYSDLGRGWGQLKQTKLVSGLLEIVETKSPKQSDAAAGTGPSWREVLGDLCSDEAFLAGPPGSAASTRALKDAVNSARFTQLRSAIMSKVPGAAPQSPNPAGSEFATMISLLADMPLPSMIGGFKVAGTNGPAALAMQQWEKNLPPSVTKGKIQVPGGPELTLWTAKLGELIPAAGLESLSKQLTTAGMSDEAGAALLEKIKAREISLAWGFSGERLLFSAGTDQKHLRLAASPEASLAAVEELKQVLPYADKPMFSFGYISEAGVKAMQAQPTLVELFDKLAAGVGGMIPEAEIKTIRTGVQEADMQLAPVRPEKMEASVGVVWLEQGFRAEQFGGMLPGALASVSGRLLAPPEDMDEALWLNWNMDPKATVAAYAGVVRLASTLYDAFWRIAPQFLPEPKIQQARVAEQLAVPKIKELFSIASELSTSALGSEAALTLDLGGTFPPLPMVPLAVSSEPVAPRLSLICQVADRAKLTDLWGRTLQVVTEVAMFLPPQAGLAGGIPEPQVTEFAGGKTYSYPIPAPMPLGEHAPNITITDSGLEIFSTSTAYPQTLASRLTKYGKSSSPAFAEARANFAPVWRAVAAFSKASAEGAPAEFTKVLSTLENLKSLDYRAYEEGGSARRSTSMAFE